MMQLGERETEGKGGVRVNARRQAGEEESGHGGA